MVEDAKVTRDDLILQDRAGGNVDAVAMVCDDDDRSLREGG